MKSREEFNSIFKDLSIRYELNFIEIKDIFIETLSFIFKGQVIELEKQETTNYGFYIYKNSGYKKVSFSPRIKKQLETTLYENINKYKLNLLKAHVKQIMKKDGLINGEVVKNNVSNFLVKTKLGICKIPSRLIQKTDLNIFTIGSKFMFKLFKYSFKKGIPYFELTRKHSLIDKYYVEKALKDYEISKVNRCYGVRIKIYINCIPKKVHRENVKLFFPKEKVIYVNISKERKCIGKLYEE